MPTASRATLAVLLLALPAAAYEPRSDWPCSAPMAKLAAASDAEVTKRFGTKASGTCTCMEEDCRFGMLAYDFPVSGPAPLALTVHLLRTLEGSADKLPSLATGAAVGAFAKKLAGHPLVAPLLADGAAKCRLSPVNSSIGAECSSAHWHVAFTEDDTWGAKKKGGRTLYKQNHRLPVAALKQDAELMLAAAHPTVAAFLTGKTDVVAELTNSSPRRMVLHSGAPAASPFAPLKGKDNLTVFFLTSDNGWAAKTESVKEVCSGEHYSRCK